MTFENPTEQNTYFSRRAALGIGATLALGLAAGDAPDQKPLLPYEDTFQQLPAWISPSGISGSWPMEQAPEVSQLPDLLHSLKSSAKQATREERFTAVVNSLRLLVSYEEDHKTPMSAGTAFEIDESGLYMTAKHILPLDSDPRFPANSLMFILNPKTGDRFYAKKFIVHNDADMAAVYAPTGKPAGSTGLHWRRKNSFRANGYG
jgi:hypothetical protein